MKHNLCWLFILINIYKSVWTGLCVFCTLFPFPGRKWAEHDGCPHPASHLLCPCVTCAARCDEQEAAALLQNTTALGRLKISVLYCLSPEMVAFCFPGQEYLVMGWEREAIETPWLQSRKSKQCTRKKGKKTLITVFNFFSFLWKY